MKVCLFHFFNSTGLTELSKRLGQNQNILIGFDPDNRRLGIIVGYGLEAYLVPHELDHILAQAEVALTQNGYYKAASLMIKTLQEKLTKIAIEIPDAYGLDNVDVLQSEY